MKINVLVIKFKELFPPNQDAFSETERGFYSSWDNIKKPLSGCYIGIRVWDNLSHIHMESFQNFSLLSESSTSKSNSKDLEHA